MKKFRTKKAFTLVELVVTVAIMSITAGVGIGIFASAMQNYSTASVTASEQEKALEIEKFILDKARLATTVYYITNDSSLNGSYVDHIVKDEATAQLNNSTASGGMLTVDAGSTYAKYYDLDKEETGGGYVNIVKSTTLQVSGLDNIKFRLYKQKAELANEESRIFNYLSYKITMENGYSISGTVLLYNCKNVTFDADDSSFVEYTKDGEFTVGGEGNTFNTGIAFLKG